MPAYNIKIKGLEELKRNLKNYPAISAPEVGDAIKKSIFKTQATAIPETPVDSGALSGSYRTSFSALKGTLTPNKEYAAYVHEGTRPHWIGHVITLSQKYGGKTVFIGMHPGTKANPFLVRAIDKASNEIENIFLKALNNILNKIAKI